ncbi:hypothetical protein F4781DRAFT_389626 [Annulohypoxylon bovei var. microspora]|nr:hypothetical protein F4781DRAFT_389626 [Annulohypoxylon bovei var. microspora]
MPVVVIAEVVSYSLLAGTVGGAVGTYCADNPGVSGCVNKKRDILNTGSIPRMMIGAAKRQDVGPCNVPKYNFDQCHDQAVSAGVTSSIPSPGEAKFDNVPPACMDLSVVLGGSCTGDGPRPEPCGSACLHYTGLTDEDLANLSNALNGK